MNEIPKKRIIKDTTLKIKTESVGESISPAVKEPSNVMLIVNNLNNTLKIAPYFEFDNTSENSSMLENLPSNNPFKVLVNKFEIELLKKSIFCKVSANLSQKINDIKKIAKVPTKEKSVETKPFR